MNANGTKSFIYVIRHEHKHGASVYLLRSDHDPSLDEVVNLLDIDCDEGHEECLDIDRFSEDEIPTLPPKA